MNTRFIEMWADAVNKSVPPRGKPFNFQVAANKFAEMIIDQCCMIIDDAVEHQEPASSYTDKIVRHFTGEESEEKRN